MASAEDLLREGHVRAARGDAAGALRAFLRAAQGDPRGVDAAAGLLGRMVADGQKARARRLLEAERIAGPVKRRLAAVVKGDAGVSPEAALSEMVALVRAGAHAEARRLSERLLANDAGSAPLLNLRGIVEIQAGAAEAAEGFLRRAVEADPAFTAASSNLGFSLLLQGRADEAEEVLEAVVAAEPGNLDALTNLASAAYRLDRIDRALDLSATVLAGRPGDETARRIRAQALWKTGRSREALEVLRGLEADLGAAFDLWRISVEVIEEIEGPEAAIAYLGPRIASDVKARLKRALLMAETGDLSGAEAEYRAILAADPSQTEALYLLALQGRLPADDPVVLSMAGLPETDLSPVAVAHLHYGLGKACLDSGDTARAFDHLSRANRAQRPSVSPAGEALPDYLASIRAAWDTARHERLSLRGVRGVAPIFVVGIQRSGSTLTEQILSAHRDVTGLGEQSLFYYGFRSAHRMSDSEFAEASERLSRDLVASVPTTRMVDKFLGNFRQLGAIAAAFPEAVIINPRRDPRSIALSVFQNRFDPQTFPWTTSLEDIARYYLEYDRHMAHWQALFGDRIIRLHYEELVSDPEATIRALLDRCGLDWDPACLRPERVDRQVDTLSIGQVRRGINTGSRARWRVFEEDLRPFTEILAAAGALPDDAET